MDATRDSQTKWSKLEGERHIPYGITFIWNLKHDTNEPIYKTETDHGHGEQTYGFQWWGRRGVDGEFGAGRCKLLHFEWISNEVLLYSTGNYIQFSETDHDGKEYRKECTYMYNWVICCTGEIGTML